MKNSNQICIFRTGKLFEHDIAANALSENKIPFFKQLESSSGLKLSMPFQPSMGPGTFYNILVPENYADDALKILNELPIDLTDNPDPFHFGGNETEKRGWKIFILAILSITAIIFLANIIKIIG